jgi:hypothetical protein
MECTDGIAQGERHGMRLTFHAAMIVLVSLLVLPYTLHAAEVSNLKTHYSSSHMTIEYDLTGTGTEKESTVDIQIEIKGRKYSPNMLSMSGDFGRSIALGSHRQITWKHSRDFPEGLDSIFKCSVNAVPDHMAINEALTPAEGIRAAYFAVNRQTVVETRIRLMWTRNTNIPVKPMSFRDAQKFVEKLNHERYAGYNDWRIPTREDFEGLFSPGQKAGWGNGFAHYIADYLTTCGFDNVLPGNYWTSTPAGADMNRLFVANTWNGIIRALEQINYYYVWPVRSARELQPVKIEETGHGAAGL